MREKEISIRDIGEIFKIKSDIALDWSKILEKGNLAIIDYPRFGRPVLRRMEEEDLKSDEEKKEKSGKEVDEEKKFKQVKTPKKELKEKGKKISMEKETISPRIVKHRNIFLVYLLVVYFRRYIVSSSFINLVTSIGLVFSALALSSFVGRQSLFSYSYNLIYKIVFTTILSFLYRIFPWG